MPSPRTVELKTTKKLISDIKRNIHSMSGIFVCSINDAYTRKNYLDAISNYLSHLKSRGCLYDYMAICDETNNPPNNNHDMIADVHIKPTNTTYYSHFRIRISYGDILETLNGLESTMHGFNPGPITKPIIEDSKWVVYGIVGLDEDGFVCNPSIPESMPFFVVARSGDVGYVLYDSSYRYFKVISGGEWVGESIIDLMKSKSELNQHTTSDMEIIDRAIQDYVSRQN